MDIDEYRKAAYDMGYTDGWVHALLISIPVGAIIFMALKYYGVV